MRRHEFEQQHEFGDLPNDIRTDHNKVVPWRPEDPPRQRAGRGVQFRTMFKAVQTASKEFLPANPNREYLLIQNNSATATVYVNFDNAADSLVSIPIAPNGFYEPLRVPINSIHMSATVANTGVVLVEG